MRSPAWRPSTSPAGAARAAASPTPARAMVTTPPPTRPRSSAASSSSSKPPTTAAYSYPGHQLARKDFKAGRSSVVNGLARYGRAMAVPVDHAQGMIGKGHVGDHVEVITTAGASGGFGAEVVPHDVPVLAIPA